MEAGEQTLTGGTKLLLNHKMTEKHLQLLFLDSTSLQTEDLSDHLWDSRNSNTPHILLDLQVPDVGYQLTANRIYLALVQKKEKSLNSVRLGHSSEAVSNYPRLTFLLYQPNARAQPV